RGCGTNRRDGRDGFSAPHVLRALARRIREASEREGHLHTGAGQRQTHYVEARCWAPVPPYSGLHLYEEAVLGFPLPLRERDRVRGKAVATNLLSQTKSAVMLAGPPEGRSQTSCKVGLDPDVPGSQRVHPRLSFRSSQSTRVRLLLFARGWVPDCGGSSR